MRQAAARCYKFTLVLPKNSNHELFSNRKIDAVNNGNSGLIIYGEPVINQCNSLVMIKGFIDLQIPAKKSAVKTFKEFAQYAECYTFDVKKSSDPEYFCEVFPSGNFPIWFPLGYTQKLKRKQEKSQKGGRLFTRIDKIYTPGMKCDDLKEAYYIQHKEIVPKSQEPLLEYYIAHKIPRSKEKILDELRDEEFGKHFCNTEPTGKLINYVFDNSNISFPTIYDNCFVDNLEKIIVCKLLYCAMLFMNRYSNDDVPAIMFYGEPNRGKTLLTKRIPNATEKSEEIAFHSGVGASALRASCGILVLDDITLEHCKRFRDLLTQTLIGNRYTTKVHSGKKENPICWCFLSSNEPKIAENIKDSKNDVNLKFLERRLICVECTVPILSYSEISKDGIENYVKETIELYSRKYAEIYSRNKFGNKKGLINFWVALDSYIKAMARYFEMNK
jgi:hypothetical protein